MNFGPYLGFISKIKFLMSKRVGVLNPDNGAPPVLSWLEVGCFFSLILLFFLIAFGRFALLFIACFFPLVALSFATEDAAFLSYSSPLLSFKSLADTLLDAVVLEIVRCWFAAFGVIEPTLEPKALSEQAAEGAILNTSACVMAE